MSRGQRVITITLWAVLLAAMVGVLAGRALAPRRGMPHSELAEGGLPILYPAPQFAMTDENGKTFSSADLRGKPWVAAFVFTTCGDVCPRMTKSMADLQHKLPNGVQMVSITVNPEHDTPEVLKQYAADYRADESRWHFLTASPEKIHAAAQAMKVAAVPAEGTSPIIHSDKLILVDRDGQIRGYYTGTEDAETAKLVADAATLAR